MLLTDLLLFPLKIDILPRRWNLQRLGKLFLMVDDNGLEPLTLRTSKKAPISKNRISHSPNRSLHGGIIRMGVSSRCLNIRMAQHKLDRPDACTALQG